MQNPGTFVTVNNWVINMDRVAYVLQEPDDVNKVTVVFAAVPNERNGLEFIGREAAELWKVFSDDKDWREST